MLIPENKYTQDQLALWISKANEAASNYYHERESLLIYHEMSGTEAWGDSPKPNPEKYKWGAGFISDILNKVQSTESWLLRASMRFTEGERRFSKEAPELPTQAFNFLFVQADKYCWDEYGDLRVNWSYDDIDHQRGFHPVRRTRMVPGPGTIWMNSPFDWEWKYKETTFMRPDKYGYGNLIFNGAMINHGTDDAPDWSSNT